jgi:hypothetical protein
MIVYEYVVEAELRTPWRMANMITWKKRRAYGTKHNYLATREECAYFIKGDIKKAPTVWERITADETDEDEP